MVLLLDISSPGKQIHTVTGIKRVRPFDVLPLGAATLHRLRRLKHRRIKREVIVIPFARTPESTVEVGVPE